MPADQLGAPVVEVEHRNGRDANGTTPTAEPSSLEQVPAHLREAARLGLTEVHPPMVMDKSKCIECGLCREVCPFTAVMLVPSRWKVSFEIVRDRCHGCGGPSKAPCVRYCPSPGALVAVPDAIVGA